MSEANKALVRRYYKEVWNEGPLAVVDEVMAADFVGHRTGLPELTGPEAVKQSVTALCDAFPNGEFTIDDMVAEEDRVVVRFTGRATHRGKFRGIDPTGKRVTVTGIRIYRVASGKIVERWESIDRLGLMQQLGVTVAP